MDFPGFCDVSLIGEGGLGVVYRAVRESTSGPVAIKVLRDRSNGSTARRRTRRELGALVMLSGHAHIVQLHEVLDLGCGSALVMEYTPGGSLADLLRGRGGTLDAAEVALVGQHTAEALVAAHACGIVHRDIKPQNLLIDAYGQVKLCDFGIALRPGSDEFGVMTDSLSTRYASPEDLEADCNIGIASDIFSLGATLLHLAHGAPPTLKDRLHGWRPAGRAQGVAGEIDRIIAACLHPTPDGRPTAEQVSDEFENLRWSMPTKTRSLNPPTRPVRPDASPNRRVWSDRKRRLLVAVAVVLAAASVGGQVLGSGLSQDHHQDGSTMRA